MKKGIFWVIDGELLCISVTCDENGTPLEYADFSSRSGDNFNHKAEWANLSKKTTRGKTFDHYRRGRVEIKKGKLTVFLNPAANTEEMRAKIIDAFSLKGTEPRFVSDGSAHYRALIDVQTE